MATYKMVLAYDGTRYRGWQRLGSGDTIQGRVESALAQVLGVPVQISGSGRTDAGAHAKGQVASFQTDTRLSPQRMLSQLRHILPEDIGVLELEQASPRFHARLCASQKTYCYRIWNSPVPCVFDRRYVWQLPSALDVPAMAESAQQFLGRHDFRGFCANRQMKKSTVRTITACTVARCGQEVRFTVTGDGFLHHMVRILVGTLVEIGQGKRLPESIPAVLASGVRAEAGETAPARGLCLMEVRYQ